MLSTHAFGAAVMLFAGIAAGGLGSGWARRIVRKDSVSLCPGCGRPLSVSDCVPLFSFLLLRGKYRCCGSDIPRREAFVPLLAAAYFLSCLLRCGVSLSLPRFLGMGFFLLTASLVDLDTMELPNELLLAAAAFSLLRLFEESGAWKSMLSGALLIPVLLLLFVLYMDRRLGRDTMGGGDIKLLSVLGLHFGSAQLLLLLILSCLLGLLVSVLRKRGKSEPFPFGPMLVLSAWGVMLFGAPLLRCYLSLF